MNYRLSGCVRVDHLDTVRLVTIDRPDDDLNRVNAALHSDLTNVWRVLADDRQARAVVLTAAGRAFSAGGDFDWLMETHTDPASHDAQILHAERLIGDMISFPLPVVAAVNGPAVGLGCSLAVLCDIVLVAESAHFADPHVAVGLVAGDGGAVLWPLMTSLLRAKEYVFTGDRISATAAVALGLANRVVPDEKLREEALALAQRLAELPPRALQDTKRAMNAHLGPSVSSSMPIALLGERQSLSSEEHGQFLRQATARRQEG